MSYRSPIEHCRAIVERFSRRFRGKYSRGQKENGDHLWEHSLATCLRNAREEADDQVAYVDTACDRWRLASDLVEDALHVARMPVGPLDTLTGCEDRFSKIERKLVEARRVLGDSLQEE